MSARIIDTANDADELKAEITLIMRSISHDLRAPLRAAKGFTAAVTSDFGDQLPDEATAHLREVTIACDRMSAMLEGLSAVSRIIRAELHPEKVDLTELGEHARTEIFAASPERRPVTFEIEPRLEGWGDRALLRLAVRALLDNAWKFTSKAERASIRMGAYADGDLTGFFVSDDGAGFEPRYAANLFQPFQRLHRTDEYPGLGIGLSVVRAAIGRHRGRIVVDGSVGRGATFRIGLPSPNMEGA